MRRVERVTDHLRGAARASAAAAPVADRGQAVRCWRPARSSGRSCSAATTGPASCWRPRCAPTLNRYAAAPGRRVAVFTNNDDGWRTAIDLARRRCRGRGRDRRAPAGRPTRLRARLPACASCRRSAGRHGAMAGSTLRQRSPCAAAARTETLAADALAVSGGWNPAVHLTCHHGGRPAWNETHRGLRARTSAAGRHDGRRCRQRRLRRSARCLADGARAGARRGGATGHRGAAPLRCLHADDEALARDPALARRRLEARRSSTCRTTSPPTTSRSPQREGFGSVEHLKRYTTLGMATDQGKTSNVTGLAHHGGADRPRHPRDRHHHLPAALHAGRDRRARRPSSRRGLPPDAAARRRMTGPRSRAPSSSRPARGCARNTIRAPARPTGSRPSTARSRRCARRSASATSRRSARSTCRARMPASSSTASTSTPSPTCRSARRATA